MTAPVDTLSGSVSRATSLPLLSVGSGGSFTTAHFAAAVHRQYTSRLSTVMTPLEAVVTPQSLASAAVLLLSAGGSNPDVLGAFRRLVAREPYRLMVLCTRVGSPLSRIAAGNSFVEFSEFDMPSGKDGFLATNSLMASAVLLLRAYAHVYEGTRPLPMTFSELLGDELGLRPLEEIDRRCRPLWGRSMLVVLHGPETLPAAIDLESKFTEAALGGTQIADYRSFAHGRHHWLAKRGDESGVLAILSDGDRELAEGMLALFPANVPVVRLVAQGSGAAAALSALVQGFMVAGSAGSTRGIDPGDPGVPAFGRQIYHMQAFQSKSERGVPIPSLETAAIERKSGRTIASLVAQGRLDEWREHYRRFIEKLATATFRGVVLDYDGTLCDQAHRFEPLVAAVGKHLSRFLRTGIRIGLATGRGKSVRQALRGAVDRELWGRILVGYYNGGDVGSLDDDEHPDGSDRVDDVLSPVVDALQTEGEFLLRARITLRRPQITIEPRLEVHADQLWESLQQLLYRLDVPGVIALRSSHSMDVMASRTSKRTVVARVREALQAEADAPILCIGDRGRWPGNDFSLLSSPYSLSVDEVSADPRSCWNLAVRGRRGSQVTLDYFEQLIIAPGKAVRYRPMPEQ